MPCKNEVGLEQLRIKLESAGNRYHNQNLNLSANCTVRAGTVVLTKRPTDGANNCRTGTPKCVRLNKLKTSVRTSRLRSSIKRKSLLTAKTITVTPGARNVLRPHRTVYVAGSDKHTLALKRCRKLVTQRSF